MPTAPKPPAARPIANASPFSAAGPPVAATIASSTSNPAICETTTTPASDSRRV